MSRHNSRIIQAASAKNLSRYIAQAQKQAGINSDLTDSKKDNEKPDINTKKDEEVVSVSQKENLYAWKLQEAVIWAEILGKPLSKRGKRRKTL